MNSQFEVVRYGSQTALQRCEEDVQSVELKLLIYMHYIRLGDGYIEPKKQ